MQRTTLAAFALVLMTMMGAFAPMIILPTPVAAYVNDRGYSVNGNQELLADPVRPLVYFCDPTGDSVWIWDGSSPLAGNDIVVGHSPLSLALGRDGKELYASVSTTNSIKVIDIDSGQVVRSVNLSFSPRSVRAGPPGRLCVSGGEGDTMVRMVNETTGAVVAMVGADGNSVLETSPDGQVMLVTTLGTSPTMISKYSLANDTVTKLQEGEFGEIGGNLRQVAVDWAHGKIYLAVADIHLIVLSLGTLRMTTSYSTGNYPAGVALSPDGSLVFAWGDASPNLEVYSTGDGSRVGSTNVERSPGPLAISSDGGRAFLGAPAPTVLPNTMGSLVPTVPRPGYVYGYTPSYVELAYVPGLVELPVGEANITINGQARLTIPIEEWGVRYYRGWMASPLDDGPVTVNASMRISGFVLCANYSFAIDRQSQDAWRPLLAPFELPSAFYSVPFNLNVTAFVLRPEPLGYLFTMTLDGSYVSAPANGHPGSANVNVTFLYTVSAIGLGQHTVEAVLSYEGETQTRAATFYLGVEPSLTPLLPAPDSTLSQAPANISVGLDHGTPAVDITAVSIALDGAPLVVTISGHTANGALSASIADGHHTVAATMTAGGATKTVEWAFNVSTVAAPDFTRHDSGKGYSILVPAGWTVQEDATAGGYHVDTYIKGPISFGIQTNVIVVTGIDAFMRDTQDYLEQQVQVIVNGLAQQGMNVVITDAPHYMKISNHSAVVFGYDLSGSTLHQKGVMIIDAEHMRYWTISCTASQDAWSRLDPVFDAMVNGFAITSAPGPTRMDIIVLLAIGGGIGGALMAALAYVLWRAKRARKV